MHMVADNDTQWFCLEIFNFKWCVCKRDKALRSVATANTHGLKRLVKAKIQYKERTPRN